MGPVPAKGPSHPRKGILGDSPFASFCLWVLGKQRRIKCLQGLAFCAEQPLSPLLQGPEETQGRKGEARRQLYLKCVKRTQPITFQIKLEVWSFPQAPRSNDQRGAGLRLSH